MGDFVCEGKPSKGRLTVFVGAFPFINSLLRSPAHLQYLKDRIPSVILHAATISPVTGHQITKREVQSFKARAQIAIHSGCTGQALQRVQYYVAM